MDDACVDDEKTVYPAIPAIFLRNLLIIRYSLGVRLVIYPAILPLSSCTLA